MPIEYIMYKGNKISLGDKFLRMKDTGGFPAGITASVIKIDHMGTVTLDHTSLRDGKTWTTTAQMLMLPHYYKLLNESHSFIDGLYKNE